MALSFQGFPGMVWLILGRKWCWFRCLGGEMSQGAALNRNGANMVFYPQFHSGNLSLHPLSISPKFAVLGHVICKEQGAKVSVVNYLS